MKKCSKEFNDTLKSFMPLKGKTICVAFSGGADSVCLLYLLKSVKDEYGFNLIAAHVNHHLRGEEADRDALFCQNFCIENNIPFNQLDIDVLGSMNKSESIEEAARKLRYEALNTVKFDLLATAHHLNDNIETIIINLLRGSGLKGMCGIPIFRDNIIRPLLKLSKKQILKFCDENNLEFVTDSTNESDDYVRNLIRHKIIPIFEKISPSYEKVFSRNIELLKSDEDYISTKACELFKTAKTDKGIDISCLENIHTSLLTRVVRMFTVEVTGITPDLFHIERFAHLIAQKSGSYELAKGYIAKVKNGYFFFEDDKKNNYNVSYSIISKKIYNNSLKVNKLLLKNAVDYDKICGEFSIRTRKTGDRLRIKNRGLTKSVRRIQQEKNISVSKRDILPIASDDKGAFWGYLIGTDERVLVDDNTNNVLIFKIEEN